MLTAPVRSNALPISPEEKRQLLVDQGYRRWEWLKSGCLNCDLVVISTEPKIQTPKVQAFIATLGERKSELIALYQSRTGITGAEYNLLAQMAVGILGRESSFFESERYKLKEQFPTTVAILKILDVMLFEPNHAITESSRGPTQIKIIPELINDRYGLTPDDLVVPENAAIATMGFLIESLTELKRRAATNHLAFVTPANYSDYLPYLYFGARKQLISGKATPNSNIYVRDMKKYMQWVELYEKDAVPNSTLH